MNNIYLKKIESILCCEMKMIIEDIGGICAILKTGKDSSELYFYNQSKEFRIVSYSIKNYEMLCNTLFNNKELCVL